MPVSLIDISFRYDDSQILKNVNLEVGCNETIAILGKSGSGKSTLLNVVSGFSTPSKGRVSFNGVKPGDIAYIRQSAMEMLFPWKNVQENIDFALKEKNKLTADSVKRNDELLNVLKLDAKRTHYPSELSGGEKKRLSFSCGLSYSPKLILLDEAFTGIDFSLKWELWSFLRSEIIKLNAQALIVTHDFDEAILLADKIVFLNSSGSIDEIVIDTRTINKERVTSAISSQKFNDLKLEVLEAYNEINDKI